MDTAMTTYARGVSATKRAVGVFTGIERWTFGRTTVVKAAQDGRSVTTADSAERQAMQRDHAWIEAAAIAGMRMHPRG
jgi:hypothetical protein